MFSDARRVGVAFPDAGLWQLLLLVTLDLSGMRDARALQNSNAVQ